MMPKMSTTFVFHFNFYFIVVIDYGLYRFYFGKFIGLLYIFIHYKILIFFLFGHIYIKFVHCYENSPTFKPVLLLINTLFSKIRRLPVCYYYLFMLPCILKVNFAIYVSWSFTIMVIIIYIFFILL